MGTLKLQDTSELIGRNSRQERYWMDRGFEDFYKKFRKGVKLPQLYHTVESKEKIIKIFHLNSIGYGNWVTQEDRFNYLSALIIAMYDLNKVLDFGNNIGLNNKISFSFGARGKGGALAHFEPSTFIINITRYIDVPTEDKETRFVLTGGAGSVAHEYGHALDYYFGMYVDQSRVYSGLSMGNSVSTLMRHERGGIFRKLMDDLLMKIIWKEEGKVKSDYYERLEKNFGGDYFFRRNELFARGFEQYVQYELQERGILNKFLNDTKYTGKAYMTAKELKAVIPHFRALMAAFKKQVKK